VSFFLLILVLVVLGTLGYRLTSPAERERYLGLGMGFGRRMKLAMDEPGPEYEAFRHALRARSRYTLVMPAIVAINVAVFFGMLFGVGAISDPNTLIAWGASVGTRTSNGEWWRLVTSTFLHLGILHLIVDVAVLIQLGAVLERLVGRLAFIAVYISAGVFAGLVNLSSHPVGPSVGVSGAIFGLYGVLLAALFFQMFLGRRGHPQPDGKANSTSGATIPLISVMKLGIGAAVFLAYSTLSGMASNAEAAGLVVGLGYGSMLTRRVREKAPRPNDVGAVVAAACVLALMCALTLRNIADVKPEINGVLAAEERTVVAFQAASEAFKKGRLKADALAQYVERTIVGDLQAVDARLKALRNVPAEDQPLVTDAREYLRLRSESWHARAEAIRATNADADAVAHGGADAHSRLQAEARFKSNKVAMGHAESTERASLEAFARITRAR
jgi:membrane associated rhomboid family serine protease